MRLQEHLCRFQNRIKIGRNPKQVSENINQAMCLEALLDYKLISDSVSLFTRITQNLRVELQFQILGILILSSYN